MSNKIRPNNNYYNIKKSALEYKNEHNNNFIGVKNGI